LVPDGLPEVEPDPSVPEHLPEVETDPLVPNHTIVLPQSTPLW